MKAIEMQRFGRFHSQLNVAPAAILGAAAMVIAAGAVWAQVPAGDAPAAPAVPSVIATAMLPRDLSPWGMFMNADIVVKVIMIGLVFASLVTWTVWLAKTIELHFAKRAVWSLAEAREALERLIGRSDDWSRLDEFLLAYVVEPSLVATVFASSLASTLEMVREGVMEVHQHAPFAPIYVRKRPPAKDGNGDGGPAIEAGKDQS